MRTDIDDDLVAGELPHATVVELDPSVRGPRQAPASRDQFGAARFEGRNVVGDLSSTISRLRWRTFAISIVTGP